MTDLAHHLPPITPHGLAELAPLFDALAAVAIRGEVPGPELLSRVAAGPAGPVGSGAAPQRRRALLAQDSARRRQGGNHARPLAPRTRLRAARPRRRRADS